MFNVRWHDEPFFIETLAGMRFLYLGENSLSGSIPEWIGNLSSLEVIALNINRFTGSIPSSISKYERPCYW